MASFVSTDKYTPATSEGREREGEKEAGNSDSIWGTGKDVLHIFLSTCDKGQKP